MDAFTKTVVATTLLMFVVLGAIVALGLSNANRIPDVQSGVVQTKTVVSASNSTYTVQLTDGQVFYVLNTALYDSLMVNQTYVFTNHIDAYKHMTIVDSAEPPATPTPTAS